MSDTKQLIMKRFTYLPFFLIAMVVMLSSCEAIGDVFQAGMTVGIVVVVIVVILIIWLVSRFRK